MARYSAELTEDEFFDVMTQLRMFDHVRFSEMGRIEIELNDLQKVAVAAAMGAWVEHKVGKVV